MKVLLVRPPSVYKENLHGFQLDLPLGLLYLGAVLEKNGHQVEIFDTRLDLGDKRLLNTYHNRQRMAEIWQAIEAEVAKRKPQAVGISNQFSAQFQSTVQLARIVKKINPKILTVVGGPHASCLPDSFLNYAPEIDLAVMGEGEETFAEILEAREQGKDFSLVRGLAFRKDGQVCFSQRREFISDLDKLPLPAYHLVNLERYFQAEDLGFSVRGRYYYPGTERAIPLITSRGCPYGCIFCSIHLHMGRKWRTHSVAYILRHIDFLKKRYQIRHIHFEDDNINCDRHNFLQLVNSLQGLNLSWDTPNGLRADRLDEETIKKCKASGCTYLIVGVESAVPRVLKEIIGKKLDINEVIKVAKLCKKARLDLRAFYVIGLPGETPRDIKRTANFALMLKHKYDVFPHMHVAYPHIGTPLYELCRQKGYLSYELGPETFEKIISGVRMIETKEFSLKDIDKIHAAYDQMLAKVIRLKLLKEMLRDPLGFLIYLRKVIANPSDRKRLTEDFVAFSNCRKRKWESKNV